MSATLLSYEKKETLLRLDHVSLQFGDHVVLRDVNAAIQDIVRPGMIQGQVIGILGPSGVGKTQLSRIIAGLQEPTSGSIVIDGQGQRRRQRVGMVAQNYILFDWATVQSNLLIAGQQGGLPADTAMAHLNNLAETFGLHPYLSYYPAQLSGGTRQRVAIAQQLMARTTFLIMDEPFSGLDPVMKARACDLITQVADLDERNTILVVTHDIAEAASIADTLWLLGQDKDAAGQFIPGARIVEDYDLAAMGLCWRPDITHDPEFITFVEHVKQRFATLKQF